MRVEGAKGRGKCASAKVRECASGEKSGSRQWQSAVEVGSGQGLGIEKTDSSFILN